MPEQSPVDLTMADRVNGSSQEGRVRCGLEKVLAMFIKILLGPKGPPMDYLVVNMDHILIGIRSIAKEAPTTTPVPVWGN